MTTFLQGSAYVNEAVSEAVFSFEGAKARERRRGKLQHTRAKTFKAGKKEKSRLEDRAAGADDDEDPPVPMPNTEVKLVCAEDTWMVTSRENR